EAARPCRHAVGNQWQVDETYVKVAGRWRYVYRAIDQFGQVIDVYVSPRRDDLAGGGRLRRAGPGDLTNPRINRPRLPRLRQMQQRLRKESLTSGDCLNGGTTSQCGHRPSWQTADM